MRNIAFLITKIKLHLAKLHRGILRTYSDISIRVWARRRLKSFQGKDCQLTNDQKQQINQFFKPYLKPWKRYKFHQFYTGKTNEFHVEYIPDDYFFSDIDRYFNDWDKSWQMDDKCYYDRLFSSSGFTLPETICYCINGIWLDSRYVPIGEEDSLSLIISAGKAFLKKAVGSKGGHGVRLFDSATCDKDFLRKILCELGDNIIVQKPVIQSPIIAQLNNSSVNTLRLLSLLDKDGSVKIYSVVLRIGMEGSIVDNASSGGLTCGVTPSGRLKSYAYTAGCEKIESCHPINGIKFDTIVIPNYQSVLDKVRKAHPQLANFRLLSWDIAIGEDNQPVLLEVNMSCGELYFHQLNNGPLFGSDTQKILDEVWQNNAASEVRP